jgi:hypothetical protein
LRDQETEFSIAQDCDRFADWNPHLLEDLARCRDGLSEYRPLGWEVVGYSSQIRIGQSQVFGERARMLNDSEHSPVRTVPAEAARAVLAAAACEIDLAHHTPAGERCGVALYHLTDELVSRDSTESVVPALQLQIRVADSAA